MTGPSPRSLRRATGADALAVARMHVATWQTAHRGIVPDAFLDAMDVAARAARYAFDRLGPGDPATWIAVDGDHPAGILARMELRPPALPAIRTERFELVSMSLAFMQALAAGELDAAARELGAELADGMQEDLANFLAYRIPALKADPESRPWLGRSIVMTHSDGRREVIGTIGFHAPPDEDGRVEIGYRVEAAFRRSGIATECIGALLAWAESMGTHRFRASVAPDNVASLALVRSFGFRQVGVQTDEIDGDELVFDLDRA